MIVFPAIDLIDGKAVRLVKGDYAKMTVYDTQPLRTALRFEEAGAKYLHTVDLEGARDGGTPNFSVVEDLIRHTGLSVEIGGGIRDMKTVEAYINAGAFRVILGTAAVTDPEFLKTAVDQYGDKIAVGVDIRDSKVAIKGWLQTVDLTCFDFFRSLENLGVKTVICTDISKDGLLGGANFSLYRSLSESFSLQLVASGGVSTEDDILKLKEMNLYGVILGKALYENRIDLNKAILLAQKEA